MTGYHIYLTYGRYVYPSPKIMMHGNKIAMSIIQDKTVQYVNKKKMLSIACRYEAQLLSMHRLLKVKNNIFGQLKIQPALGRKSKIGLRLDCILEVYRSPNWVK